MDYAQTLLKAVGMRRPIVLRNASVVAAHHLSSRQARRSGNHTPLSSRDKRVKIRDPPSRTSVIPTSARRAGIHTPPSSQTGAADPRSTVTHHCHPGQATQIRDPHTTVVPDKRASARADPGSSVVMLPLALL